MSSNHCLLHRHLNPLSHSAFYQKRIFWKFWGFSGWRLAKLALIESKMHLQHDSLLFLSLAPRFATFWLRSAQKSNFLKYFRAFLFFLFSFHSAALKNFQESVIEMGIFFHGVAPCSGRNFALNFLSLFPWGCLWHTKVKIRLGLFFFVGTNCKASQ